MSPRSVYFSSETFDLACGWFDKFAVFPSGGSPINGTYKLLAF